MYKKLLLYFFLLLSFVVTLSATPRNKSIRGVVVNSISKEAIDEVLINIDNISTIKTDAKGYFQFVTDKSEIHLNFSKIAYHTKSEKFNLNQIMDSLIIIELVNISTNSIDVIASKYKDIKISKIFNSEISNKELNRNLSQTLANTLKKQTGISIHTMGPATARPVYRGMGGNRILFTQDGFEVNDLSYSSPDHTLTADPFISDKIEILTGPENVLFSTFTIGSVINLNKELIPKKLYNNFGYEFALLNETANNGFKGSMRTFLPIDNFSINSNITLSRTDNLKSSKYILKNTESENLNFTFGVNYFMNNFAELGFYLEELNSRYGLPGGFIGAHPNGADIEIEKRDIALRFFSNQVFDTTNNFEIKFKHSHYYHAEYESNKSIAAEFSVSNYNTKIIFNQLDILNSENYVLNGTIGADLIYSDFKTGAYVFTPATVSKSLSFFTVEELIYKSWILSFGFRLQYDNYNPQYNLKGSELPADLAREFLSNGLSLLITKNINKNLNFGINFNLSQKPPTILDLYNSGPHLASYTYDIGNTNLKKENGSGIALNINYENDDILLSATGYWNDYDSYIINTNTGDTNYSIILPIYKANQIGAVIYGVDLMLNKKINDFRFILKYTALSGKSKNSEYLPLMPPPNALIEVNYNIKKFNIGAEYIFVSEQNKLAEFEEYTDSYSLFNIFASYNFIISDTYHTITLNIENLLNVEYRNHLSRIKSIMPEPGINIRILYRFYY
jgi:iron complex outermembrane receptor protein